MSSTLGTSDQFSQSDYSNPVSFDVCYPQIFLAYFQRPHSPISLCGPLPDRGSVTTPKYFTIPCRFRLPSASPFARVCTAIRCNVANHLCVKPYISFGGTLNFNYTDARKDRESSTFRNPAPDSMMTGRGTSISTHQQLPAGEFGLHLALRTVQAQLRVFGRVHGL